MFGNKNAGLQATWVLRLGLFRREAKPKNVRTQTVIRIPRKDFDRFDQRETYFAVRVPFRWMI